MFAPLRNHVKSLLSHQSLIACKDGGYREQGLFTIYKKLPEILVGNFRSVRTVRVVYHLPKISGLSRRARLDFSYHVKLHSERPNRVNGPTFSEFPFVPGIFQWDEPKNVYHLHPNQNFPGICGKW